MHATSLIPIMSASLGAGTLTSESIPAEVSQWLWSIVARQLSNSFS